MELRRYRRALRLTQSELAERAGVSAGYISHLETGKRANPSLPVMGRLAAALHITVGELLAERAG